MPTSDSMASRERCCKHERKVEDHIPEKENDTLQATVNQLDNEDLANKMKWLEKIAGQHATLGNKLLATARRINARVTKGKLTRPRRPT